MRKVAKVKVPRIYCRLQSDLDSAYRSAIADGLSVVCIMRVFKTSPKTNTLIREYILDMPSYDSLSRGTNCYPNRRLLGR